jgi:pyocin large subunit-like protein
MALPTGASWGDPTKLVGHFLKHGAQVGARSVDEYAAMASNFLQVSQSEGYPTKMGYHPVYGFRIYVYDPATNTFGAYHADGTTATFFKPSNPTTYYNKQPGTTPWIAP